MIIGRNFLVKVNANIATRRSPLPSKKKWKSWYGPRLGSGYGDGSLHRSLYSRNPRWILRNSPVPIGTVPIYQALGRLTGSPKILPGKRSATRCWTGRARCGLLHYPCGRTAALWPMTAKRLTGIVSRGGSIMANGASPIIRKISSINTSAKFVNLCRL